MHEFIELNQIELNGNHVGDVMLKPTTPIYVVAICGVGCLIINSIWMRALGLFLLALTAAVMFGMKDQKVISVYDDCIVILKGNMGCKILLDEIEEWNTNITEQYKLFIKLKSGETTKIETYRMDQADKLMRQLIPEKNTVTRVQEKTKNMDLNPVKAVKKLFSKKSDREKKGE